jgi:ribosomal protein L37AE/L43A
MTTTTTPAAFVPTLSAEYDALRHRWAAVDGWLPVYLVPECEVCEGSVAHANIRDTGASWACDACAEEAEGDFWPSDEAERRAERAQMGRTD